MRRAPKQPAPSRCAPAHPHGITLVEVVLSSIVLSFVATGAVRLLVAVVDRREAAVRDSTGAQLAEQLLAEAMARQFETPTAGRGAEFGRSVGEAAGLGWGGFDDGDDFDGWSATPPVLANGTAIAGLDGWTRRASVVYVNPSDLGLAVVGPTDMKRITVVVEFLGRPIATRVGCRSWAGQQTVEAP
ncbi:MAG: Tfp pilus assembly protein PilV [Phycisphaerales bacterium]|jgi:Tfp pilus assembly protein PilV